MSKDHTPMKEWGLRSAQGKWASMQAERQAQNHIKFCPDCGAAQHRENLECTECGHVFEKKIAASK